MPKSRQTKTLTGSEYSDQLNFESSLNNYVRIAYGLGGDDHFTTRGRVSFGLALYGGEGNDEFDSGSGVEDFYSSKGALQKNAVRLYGESGNDRIIDMMGGSYFLSGGDGDDNIAYHTNNGRSYGFKKPDLLIDGGLGNDKISYFNFPQAKGIIRGGDGDDLIGIGGKSGGGGIRYFGDAGDDVFSLMMLPLEKTTYIDGGDGTDEIYLTDELASRLVRTEDYGYTRNLVFAYWQINGVTTETTVSLSGIESIGTATEFIPYKWGSYNNGAGSPLYEYWATNGGFS
jgi:hypothetical protein